MEPMALLFSLIILASVDYSFSAIFLKMRTLPSDAYIKLRTTSRYPGLLFSYTDKEKNQICRDYFYGQLYKATGPEFIQDATKDVQNFDELAATDGKQHPLTVKKLWIGSQRHPHMEDICFECVGQEFQTKISHAANLFISSAFLPGFFYTSLLSDDEINGYMMLLFYMGMSPQYVPLRQDQLEEKYMNVHQTISALRKESSEYIQLVEEKDDLSELSRGQKLFLCASVLSSPIFQAEYPEFSDDWMFNNDESFKYEKKFLSFTEEKYVKETFLVDCIHCNRFKDDFNKDGTATDILLTRSHVNKNSVYVLIEKNGVINLSKYFERASILMNPEEHTEMFLYNSY